MILADEIFDQSYPFTNSAYNGTMKKFKDRKGWEVIICFRYSFRYNLFCAGPRIFLQRIPTYSRTGPVKPV